jgi:hypothetical protein
MGYNILMFKDLISFVLRISLIAGVCAFAWRLTQPKTQLMRVIRAALLLACLLAVLAVLRIAGA